MSRSKSSAGKSGSSEQEKGKGKEKEEGPGRNNVNGDAVLPPMDGPGAKQEKLDRIVSLMNLRGTSTTTTTTGAGAGTEKEKEEEKQNEKRRPPIAEPDLLVPPPLVSRSRSHSPPASVRSRHSRSLLNVETHKGDGAAPDEAGADAVGEDSDAIGNADVDGVGAGQLIDEQTAVKSRTGFAIFRVAEALVRGGVKRMCGTCFGYGD